MNEHYDYDRARAYLTHIRTDFLKPSPNRLPSLCDIDVAETWFHHTQHPPSDRLMRTVNGEDEELIMTIQGVLCSSTLPPLPSNRRYSRTLPALRNMRQYVQVTGLGLPQFDDAVDKMRLIQELYETSNPAHTVKDVRFTPYEGHRTLESSARYFTDRYLIPDEKNIAFGRLVDPEGVLSKLKPDSFIHGPDNTVEYCTLFALGEDGRHKYEPCDPRLFKAGDIVEIAFTCIGIPTKGDRRCLLVNLKAVTLVCDQFRKASLFLNHTIRGADKVLRNQEADRAAKATREDTERGPERVGNQKRRCLYVDMAASTTPPIPSRRSNFEPSVDRRVVPPRTCNIVGGTMEVDGSNTQ